MLLFGEYRSGIHSTVPEFKTTLEFCSWHPDCLWWLVCSQWEPDAYKPAWPYSNQDPVRRDPGHLPCCRLSARRWMGVAGGLWLPASVCRGAAMSIGAPDISLGTCQQDCHRAGMRDFLIATPCRRGLLGLWGHSWRLLCEVHPVDLTPLGYFYIVLTQDVAWILSSFFVCYQQLVWGCRWSTTCTDPHMKEMVTFTFTLAMGLLWPPGYIQYLFCMWMTRLASGGNEKRRVPRKGMLSMCTSFFGKLS